MKRILFFAIFGPLIGSLVISIQLAILQFFSDKSNVSDGYEFAYSYFLMSIFSGAAYIYGLVPAIATGLLSLKFQPANTSNIIMLIVFSVVITCLVHYFCFRVEPRSLFTLSILPSFVSTLILALILNKKG